MTLPSRDLMVEAMGAITIEAGMRVIITDVDGHDHEVEALSGVEKKGHSFPVVWVNRPMKTGDFEPMPWPADSVRAVPNG